MPIKTKKNIKKRISNYILKRGDICCEEDFNRTKVVDQIFNLYEYRLDDINNDILLFIGYLVELHKKNDKTGIGLWKEIDTYMPIVKSKNKDKKNITKLLNSLPLFYLLSFLGMASYKTID